MPAVLIEVGFISNPEEEELLVSCERCGMRCPNCGTPQGLDAGQLYQSFTSSGGGDASDILSCIRCGIYLVPKLLELLGSMGSGIVPAAFDPDASRYGQFDPDRDDYDQWEG